MFTLKGFPVKELTIRLVSIAILVLSFKMVTTKTNQPVIQKSITEDSLNVKPELLISTNEDTEKLLALVDKLNAHIEEQVFLLSKTNQDGPYLENLIQSISTRLDEIEKEAKNKNVNNLIDWPQIDELKNKIESYKQVYQQ